MEDRQYPFTSKQAHKTSSKQVNGVLEKGGGKASLSEKQLLHVEICLLREGSQSRGSKTIPTALHSIYYLYSAYCCSHGVLSRGSKGAKEDGEPGGGAVASIIT